MEPAALPLHGKLNQPKKFEMNFKWKLQRKITLNVETVEETLLFPSRYEGATEGVYIVTQRRDDVPREQNF